MKNKATEKLDELSEKIDILSMGQVEYIATNMKKIMWYNFVLGLVRGLGMAVGFTILGAVSLLILQKIVAWNLPGLSEWIAEIINLVKTYKQ